MTKWKGGVLTERHGYTAADKPMLVVVSAAEFEAQTELLAACIEARRCLRIAQENAENIGGTDCAEAEFFNEPLAQLNRAIAKARGEK